MSDQYQQATQGRGVSLITLGIIALGGFILVCGGVFLERNGLFTKSDRASSSNPEGGDTARRSPLDALRSEQVLVDETVAVGPGGHYVNRFVLPSSRPVRVIAEGVQATTSGFAIHCVDAHGLAKLKSGEKFECVTDLSTRKIQKFDHTSRLPKGEHIIVITNSENWFYTMQVRIRIILDPQ